MVLAIVVHFSGEQKMFKVLKYCHVIGGKDNLDFHAYLSDITIARLKKDGCKVIIFNKEI